MWDPGKYLDYADLRARPFHDLLARVRADSPRRVADAGCGPGNLTAVLRNRWPGAVIEAFDSSPEMVDAARSAGIAAHIADVRDWTPSPDTDVVVTNAVLQWVPGHEELLRRWAAALPSGAWLAMQVPANFDAPSHTLLRSLAAGPRWSGLLGPLRSAESVRTPVEYADLLTDAGCSADAWETTYIQPLTGENAVLEWIIGTALRPIRATLDDTSWAAFRTELAPLLAAAYPPRPDGTVWFPFRRIFVVAQRI